MTAQLEATQERDVHGSPNEAAMAARLKHRTLARLMLAVPALVSLAVVPFALRHGIRVSQVAPLVVLYVLTLLGITVGYHRLLAHRAFEVPGWLRATFTVFGAMAGQGPPFFWVAHHRNHHGKSDQPGDSHSPYWDGEQRLTRLQGLLHAHVGWLMRADLGDTALYCRDLLRDPIVRAINRHYLACFGLGFVAPAIVTGLWTGQLQGYADGFVWGGFVRLFLAHQFTLSVNSICHAWGTRRWATGDESRNNVWLALPTLGESWHNNHHAFPTSAFFGLSVWQVDPGAWVIRALEKLGIATRVRRPKPERATSYPSPAQE